MLTTVKSTGEEVDSNKKATNDNRKVYLTSTSCVTALQAFSHDQPLTKTYLFTN